ncbi:MAG: outer membrane beta-barrel protein [Bdellovibrionaceae bacterium]|nr:outer membrane beta-barrel protein [Pseudobdellovibrionaceae bacterium]
MTNTRFQFCTEFILTVNSNAPGALTGTPSVASPLVQNKYHVFDTYHDDLQLSFARLQIQKNTEDVTTTLDFGYGPTMQMVSGSKTDSAQLNLKQATIAYKPTDRLTIEVGRFVNFFGF